MQTRYWTVDDLERLPDDEGTRREIIDGVFYLLPQPDWQHQFVSGQLFAALQLWSNSTQAGMANLAPGIVYSKGTAVAPDVVWISREQLRTALQPNGKLNASPELVIEILSPGSENTHRDRSIKLDLYSRRGVEEYWIVNWRERTIDAYQRRNDILTFYKIFNENDVLETSLLLGFRCEMNQIFTNMLD
jgi:Uma2 family endonuclease